MKFNIFFEDSVRPEKNCLFSRIEKLVFSNYDIFILIEVLYCYTKVPKRYVRLTIF